MRGGIEEILQLAGTSSSMTEQESQDEARKAAAAVLRLAEERLSSQTCCSSRSTIVVGSVSSPPAAGGNASITNALHKAEEKIRVAQDRVSASIGKISSSDAVGGKMRPDATGAAAEAAARSLQGSIRSVQGKMSPVSALSSRSGRSSLLAQEASRSMKSALNKAQTSFRKVATSMDGFEQKASQHIGNITNANRAKSGGDENDKGSEMQRGDNNNTASRQSVDDKICRDLTMVSEQIGLCRSILSSSFSSEGTDVSTLSSTRDSLLLVIGYLEACSPRLLELVDAGTAGSILGPETLQRCLTVNDDLANVLADFDSQVDDKVLEESFGIGADPSKPSELTLASDGGSETNDQDTDGMFIEDTAWGKTTGL